ncbi:hypothetical protein DRN76_03425, partial [Methanosarcinales archaeon]
TVTKYFGKYLYKSYKSAWLRVENSVVYCTPILFAASCSVQHCLGNSQIMIYPNRITFVEFLTYRKV